MKIIFLGTGSAFGVENFHSNALVVNNKKHLLIDAGSDVRFSLHEQNLSYKDIDAVYISHFHTDHIGGLEYLAFKSFFDSSKNKIKLFIHDSFVNELWENSLKAGLGMVFNDKLQFSDFFEVIPITKEFIWENIKFRLVKTAHVTENPDISPVYGLIFKNTKTVYITSDTRFLPEELKKSYLEADIIIHDTETSMLKSVVHSHFDDLVKLDDSIKQKTYLWHYHDNVIRNFEIWQIKAQDNGFKGFLKKGQILYNL